ncbi:hypothetical protein HZC07_03640 [Candidatus Micrarchaeota archaeon]|nr:hypothetical protein [Candidatus Micrarchaeota archaeon]
MQPEVIPAILVKTKQELLHRISQVKDHVPFIQLDIMDGEFVPNKTIGLDDLLHLPKAKYEFHWMVKDPKKYIERTIGPHLHLVHVETINSDSYFVELEKAVEKVGGSLGLAINPETPIEKLLELLSKSKLKINQILVMTVHPGFSGQSYIYEMEQKLKTLRKLYPKINLEVDGGVNQQSIAHAYAAGANILAAASAIFSSKEPTIEKAIESLKKQATSGWHS